MKAILMLVAAAVLGACDQYIGSLPTLSWGVSVSLLSAPWLLVAFVAGCTQHEWKRGVLVGLACTIAALVGYGLMTLSPVENAHLTWSTSAAFARSESRVFFGALATGPLFGWFGQRWRTERAWAGAFVTAAAFCLEPFAESTARTPISSSAVAHAEIIVGIVMLGYIALARRRWHSASR